MKCEVCFSRLEEYLDGELIKHDAAQVRAHLITCADCANEFDALTAEQEIYARYDRALDVSPAMWRAIAARTAEQREVIDSGSRLNLRALFAPFFAAPRFSLAGAMAVLIFTVVIGVAYLKSTRQPVKTSFAGVHPPGPTVSPGQDKANEPSKATGAVMDGSNHVLVQVHQKTVLRPRRPQSAKPSLGDQSDVLFSDAAYSAIEEQDTIKHIEQAQNLLRSVRNIEVSDDDTEVDVSYEKALSRRLLNENIVLRRDAEMSGKFPAKTLLSSLEPLLIDIANLPDKTPPDDLRQIKDRVQKTEIVAALMSY